MARHLLPLILLAASVTGCQTTIGNFFANRARDLGDCFRVQVGVGPGIGVSVNAAGLLHLGATVAYVPRRFGVGWDYGDPYAFGAGEKAIGWDAEGDYSLALPLAVITGSGGSVVFATAGGPPYAPGRLGPRVPPFHWQIDRTPLPTLSRGSLVHGCWMFLPAVLSVVADPPRPGRRPGTEPRLLWSGPATPVNRRARVHAFDVEASVYAGTVYAKVGFSPGELLDFVLGWFGADIAGDDRALGQESAPEGAPLGDLPWERTPW